MKVVICGGGIMGVSTAYHLAQRGVGSIIIEENTIACAASGNAGGFLARNWCDHFEVGPLARQSFDLHMQFAESLPGCDYRRLDTLEVDVGASKAAVKRSKKLPTWVDGEIARTDVLGVTDTTAQVHPRKLCEALLAAAQSQADVSVRRARVLGFERSAQALTGVRIRIEAGSEEVVPADQVAITMGPWSGVALRWLGYKPVITGRRAHGIVLRTVPDQSESITAHALFAEIVPSRQAHAEVYPRPDGTIFMCGSMGDRNKELPASVNDVEVSMEIASKLKSLGDQVSSAIASATVERRQSCYMPMSQDQLPIIGRLPGLSNVFIATGHSCWGILNGPGTGKALAELMSEGTCTWLNLSDFDPARLLT